MDGAVLGPSKTRRLLLMLDMKSRYVGRLHRDGHGLEFARTNMEHAGAVLPVEQCAEGGHLHHRVIINHDSQGLASMGSRTFDVNGCAKLNARFTGCSPPESMSMSYGRSGKRT
jgi:hypothetical protein